MRGAIRGHQQRRGHLTRRTRRREHHAACERSAPRRDGAPQVTWGAHDGLRRQVEEILDARAKRAHKVGCARRLDTQNDAVHLP